MGFTTSWSLSADGTASPSSRRPEPRPDDTAHFDAFVHDTTTGTTVRAGLGQVMQSDADVWFVAIWRQERRRLHPRGRPRPPDGNSVEDASSATSRTGRPSS
jgi:hypothetical protein